MAMLIVKNMPCKAVEKVNIDNLVSIIQISQHLILTFNGKIHRISGFEEKYDEYM